MRIAYRLLAGSLVALLVACSALAADTSPSPNYQGLWWNAPPASESGWGINLAHQEDLIFATWFTYNPAGKPWWLVMTAAKGAGASYSGTLYETRGPAFRAPPFNPASVVETPVGTATFTFVDGNRATFAYKVDAVSQTKQITRQIFRPPGTLCQ